MTGLLTATAAIVFYLVSGFIIAARLFGGSRFKQLPRFLGIGVALLGILLHALFLYGHMVSDDRINLGFFDAASLVAWTVLMLVMLSSLSKPVENLGIAILPLAAMTIFLQELIQSFQESLSLRCLLQPGSGRNRSTVSQDITDHGRFLGILGEIPQTLVRFHGHVTTQT